MGDVARGADPGQRTRPGPERARPLPTWRSLHEASLQGEKKRPRSIVRRRTYAARGSAAGVARTADLARSAGAT